MCSESSVTVNKTCGNDVTYGPETPFESGGHTFRDYHSDIDVHCDAPEVCDGVHDSCPPDNAPVLSWYMYIKTATNIFTCGITSSDVTIVNKAFLRSLRGIELNPG